MRGESLLSFYFTISLHLTSGLIRGVASLEGGEFIVIVFYYFIASEICPDKRGGLPRGGQFIVIIFYYFIASEICPDKSGGLPLGGGEFIVIVFYYCIASEICPDKRGGLP